jgi:hypothetical protein
MNRFSSIQSINYDEKDIDRFQSNTSLLSMKNHQREKPLAFSQDFLNMTFMGIEDNLSNFFV